MKRFLQLGMLVLPALLGVLAPSPRIAAAVDVWSGRTFGFSRAAFASPTNPANQDRIRPTVWITRGNTQGIFNIALESGFVKGTSPADTKWADGDAVNYASLTFQSWDVWTGENPPSKVGVNAVVHLLTDDIYIDFVCNSWGQGGAGGGAFSYHRAEQPQATPAMSTSWGRIKTLYR